MRKRIYATAAGWKQMLPTEAEPLVEEGSAVLVIGRANGQQVVPRLRPTYRTRVLVADIEEPELPFDAPPPPVVIPPVKRGPGRPRKYPRPE